ncbi:hypothetical protein AGLY_016819, partial [Aphis glycines]
LSNLTVYCSDNRIVFIITLPLVYQNELTLYHLIPKPVCKLTNCLYIKPNYNFLAISKTKKLYTTYDQFHYSACKSPHNFLLCPEINPLHPRSTRPICEIQLLQDPVKVPKSCEIRQIQINKESSSHTIEGVGIVRLNSTCKGYATRDVLIPGKVNQEPYPDFIPNSVLKPSMKVTNLAIMETKNIINNKVDDLNAVSNTHNYLQFLDNNISDLEKLEQKITIYENVLGITISIGGCGILIFIINIMTHFLQQYRTRRGRNRCTSVVFRNEQNVSAIPSSQPHLATEQYKDEPDNWITNMVLVNKLIVKFPVYHDTYVYFGDYALITDGVVLYLTTHRASFYYIHCLSELITFNSNELFINFKLPTLFEEDIRQSGLRLPYSSKKSNVSKIKHNKIESGWSPSPKKAKQKSQTVRQLSFKDHNNMTPIQETEFKKSSSNFVIVENVNSDQKQHSYSNNLSSNLNLPVIENVNETADNILDISSKKFSFDSPAKYLVTPPNYINNKDNVIQNNILRNIAFLKTELRQIKDNQVSILEQLESIQSHLQLNNKSYIENNLLNDDFHDCPLPLDNETDLYVLEDKLSGDHQFKLRLVNELSLIGGKHVKAMVKRLMAKLFTDDLLSNYSFSGKKGKKPFSSLVICSILFDAIKKQLKFKNIPQNKIEETIKYVLAQAPFNLKRKLTKIPSSGYKNSTFKFGSTNLPAMLNKY